MGKPMPIDRERKLKYNDFIISKTDRSGKITYCNEIFMEIGKYSEKELLGKPHSIVRHPDMPKAIFKLLWQRIQNKEEIFAYVKNLASDGSYYWVYANITASIDNSGNIIGYYSVRRRPTESALKTIDEIYAKMVELENRDGVDASMEYLNNLLKEKGVSYDEFISSLQG